MNKFSFLIIRKDSILNILNRGGCNICEGNTEYDGIRQKTSVQLIKEPQVSARKVTAKAEKLGVE